MKPVWTLLLLLLVGTYGQTTVEIEGTVSADAVVHLPWEQHFLHLNAILALIGAPVVIALLLFNSSLRGST